LSLSGKRVHYLTFKDKPEALENILRHSITFLTCDMSLKKK